LRLALFLFEKELMVFIKFSEKLNIKTDLAI